MACCKGISVWFLPPWEPMKSRRRTKRRKAELEHFLSDHGAKLLSFTYYWKAFGDFSIEIEKDGVKHTFSTDRDDIYHGQKMICDGSYHVPGEDDKYPLLVKAIKNELFETEDSTGST